MNWEREKGHLFKFKGETFGKSFCWNGKVSRTVRTKGYSIFKCKSPVLDRAFKGFFLKKIRETLNATRVCLVSAASSPGILNLLLEQSDTPGTISK